MKIKYGFKILQTEDALYDGNVYREIPVLN